VEEEEEEEEEDLILLATDRWSRRQRRPTPVALKDKLRQRLPASAAAGTCAHVLLLRRFLSSSFQTELGIHQMVVSFLLPSASEKIDAAAAKQSSHFNGAFVPPLFSYLSCC
jgi:hypothetical protein